ncbi:MAG: hypothetical protein ACXABK_05680, partial [Candidatus Heimdallarchaeaceae archaeon]
MIESLILLYDKKIEREEAEAVVEALEKAYNIKISNIRKQDILRSSQHISRDQYNGQLLLNHIIEEEKLKYFFWIVQDDLYVPIMNFVFGLATQHFGAIVSFYRLENLEMKIKESIHECGHVLGLDHCSNNCVMQYSNTLDEALLKPN